MGHGGEKWSSVGVSWAFGWALHWHWVCGDGIRLLRAKNDDSHLREQRAPLRSQTNLLPRSPVGHHNLASAPTHLAIINRTYKPITNNQPTCSHTPISSYCQPYKQKPPHCHHCHPHLRNRQSHTVACGNLVDVHHGSRIDKAEHVERADGLGMYIQWPLTTKPGLLHR